MYIDTDKLNKDLEKLEQIARDISGGQGRLKNDVSGLKLDNVTGAAEWLQSECANSISNTITKYSDIEIDIKRIIELWRQYLRDAVQLDNQLASQTGGQPVYGPPPSPSLSITDYNVSPSDYTYSMTNYTYSMSLPEGYSFTGDEIGLSYTPWTDVPYKNPIEPQLIYGPAPFSRSITYDPYNPYDPDNPYGPEDYPQPIYGPAPFSDPIEPQLIYGPAPISRPITDDPYNPYGPEEYPQPIYGPAPSWPGITYDPYNPYDPNNPYGPEGYPQLIYGPAPSWPGITYDPNPEPNPYPNPEPNPYSNPTYTWTDIGPNPNPNPGPGITYSWTLNTSSLTSIAPWQITPSYDPSRSPLVNPNPNPNGGPNVDIDDLLEKLGGTKGGTKDDAKGGESGNSKNGTIARKGLSANIADALKRSSNLLTGGLIPTKGKSSGNSKSGGLIAGGLGLGAAGIAGGLLLNAKMKFIYFKPTDFERQDEETQNAIIGDLTEAGLNDKEILEFKNATFKVLNSELNPHIKKVEQAYDNNADFDSEFKEMYGYYLFGNSEKLDKYLLFTAMIIDGVNTTDETNIYNIINPSLEEEDVDFIYSGINMYEYMVTEDEEIEEDIEGEIDEEEKENNPSDDETDSETLQALEFLKEIGVDNEE